MILVQVFCLCVYGKFLVCLWEVKNVALIFTKFDRKLYWQIFGLNLVKIIFHSALWPPFETNNTPCIKLVFLFSTRASFLHSCESQILKTDLAQQKNRICPFNFL